MNLAIDNDKAIGEVDLTGDFLTNIKFYKSLNNDLKMNKSKELSTLKKALKNGLSIFSGTQCCVQQ